MPIGTTFQAAKLSIFWHTQKVVTVIKIMFSMCQILRAKVNLCFILDCPFCVVCLLGCWLGVNVGWLGVSVGWVC